MEEPAHGSQEEEGEEIDQEEEAVTMVEAICLALRFFTERSPGIW